MVIIFMGLGGAKRWGDSLKSSYGVQATKGGGPIFMGEINPSRHHGIDKFLLLIKNIF